MLAPKLLRAILLISLFALAHFSAPAQPAPDGGKFLPEKVGDFAARNATEGDARGVAPLPPFTASDFGVASKCERCAPVEDARVYAGPDRSLFFVIGVETESTSAAFSLLGHIDGGAGRFSIVDGLGLFGDAGEEHVRFIKGDALVDIQDVSAGARSAERLRGFAKSLADALPGESGFVPVLVLHLPDWDKKLGEGLGYAVTLRALQEEAGAKPALDAVPFDEGTEAVTAKYGGARLVVVEFPTPQHAFDADAAVNRRIAELSAAGQPVPSSYKRVGNYSVFVFDAPDAAAADKLASGVKYEKDVRWLGRNPHAEEIATRAYTSTMGGVILTTLITTGLAILLCLTVGGAIGGAIFLSRRAKHAAQEIYSDAGGMLRLNIEDLNTPPPASKMLGRGED
ncbi:MAG TPA: hypothetical protein VE642_04450 [Pyrinomonadaceae bacterium]|nr:hypothetical protein [Pyrinomonadaceae bacterium]